MPDDLWKVCLSIIFTEAKSRQGRFNFKIERELFLEIRVFEAHVQQDICLYGSTSSEILRINHSIQTKMFTLEIIDSIIEARHATFLDEAP